VALLGNAAAGEVEDEEEGTADREAQAHGGAARAAVTMVCRGGQTRAPCAATSGGEIDESRRGQPRLATPTREGNQPVNEVRRTPPLTPGGGMETRQRRS
jgi:hypothetical protein